MIKSRAYNQSDREAVLEIFSSNIGLYFAPEEKADLIEFLEGLWQESHYLVFFREEAPKELLACGGFGELENKVFLRWGMVNQAVHQQGIGTELLLQRLGAIKAKVGEIDVFMDTSQHVQGFYQKFGFEIEFSIKDGFAENIDKVRMIFSDWDQAF